MVTGAHELGEGVAYRHLHVCMCYAPTPLSYTYDVERVVASTIANDE